MNSCLIEMLPLIYLYPHFLVSFFLNNSVNVHPNFYYVFIFFPYHLSLFSILSDSLVYYTYLYCVLCPYTHTSSHWMKLCSERSLSFSYIYHKFLGRISALNRNSKNISWIHQNWPYKHSNKVEDTILLYKDVLHIYLYF